MDVGKRIKDVLVIGGPSGSRAEFVQQLRSLGYEVDEAEDLITCTVLLNMRIYSSIINLGSAAGSTD